MGGTLINEDCNICNSCPTITLLASVPNQPKIWGWNIVSRGIWGSNAPPGHRDFPYLTIEFGNIVTDAALSPLCPPTSYLNYESIDGLQDAYNYGFVEPTPPNTPVNRMSIEYAILDEISDVPSTYIDGAFPIMDWTNSKRLELDNPGWSADGCNGSVVAGSIGRGSFRLRGKIENCSIHPYVTVPGFDNSGQPLVSGVTFTITDARFFNACGIVLKIVSLCDEGRDFSGGGIILNSNGTVINPNDYKDSSGKTRPSLNACCGNESGSESGDSGNETIDILFDIDSLSVINDSYIRGFTEYSANEWNSILQYNNSTGLVDYIRSDLDPSWNGLRLSVLELATENEFSEYYGVNGPLAACWIIDAMYILEGSTNPEGTETVARTLPFSYGLLLNTYWLSNPIPYPEGDYALTEADWREIMRHELGHALGIGDWPPYGTIDEFGALQDMVATTRHIWLDGRVNPLTSEAYNRLSGGNFGRFLVPIEDDAVNGPGSAFAHWEDTDRTGRYPLANGTPYPSVDWDTMVPIWAPGIQYEITDMTRSYFADQGFFRKDTNSGPFIGPLSVKKTPDKIYTPIKFCGCGKMNKKKNIIGIFNKTTGVFTKNERK